MSMFEHIILLCPKRTVDYATLPNLGSQDIVVADRIDVARWRELSLVVKVFSHSLASGAGTITIMTLPQSWTEEEPGQQFVGASVASVVLNSGTPSPAYTVVGVALNGANCMTGMARVVARGDRSVAGPLNATIEVSFSAKVGPTQTSRLRLVG
jgi:hypothetical protein